MTSPAAKGAWGERSKSLAKILADEKQARSAEGKVSIVFGDGNDDLVATITQTLAKRGSHVVVAYKGDGTQAQDIVAKVIALGVQGVAVQCDGSSPESVKNAFNEVAKVFTNVDYAVNATTACTDGDINASMSVNFISAHNIMLYGSKALADGGSVVNISSAGDDGATVAAKGAADAYAEWQARKSTRVRINTITSSSSSSNQTIADSVCFLLKTSITANNIAV